MLRRLLYSLSIVLLASGAFGEWRASQRPAHSPFPDWGDDSKPARLEILRGGVVDGLYHNDYFGFSYRFPAGWISLPADQLKAADDARRDEMSEKAKKDLAWLSEPPAYNRAAKTLFYATPYGEGNGDLSAVPSIHFSAEPGIVPPTSMETAKLILLRSETTRQRTGYKTLGGPYESIRGKHRFYRTDFELITADPHVWRTVVGTSIPRGTLVLIFAASNREEMAQMAATAESFVFEETPGASSRPPSSETPSHR